MRSLKTLVAVSALIGVGAGTAGAGTLYAVRDIDNVLVSLDPTTLAITPIGPTGVAAGISQIWLTTS